MSIKDKVQRTICQFCHTKLKNISVLSKSYPEPFPWLHPDDVRDRGINEDEIVKVSSPQGVIEIKARMCSKTSPGLVWVDFGWGNPADGKPNINVLTSDKFCDPVSGGYPNRMFPCEVERMDQVQQELSHII
jgi:anaerobic selenocysteine-containing dehydrogenase